MDVHLPLGQVRGVSTAASIWTAAGLGVTAGIGFSHLAIYTALMTVAILRVTQSGAGMFQRQTRANTWHLRRRARNLGRLVRRFFPTTRAAKAEEGHDQPHQDPPRNTVQQGKYSMNSLKASPQDFHSLSAGSFSNTQRWETDETDASQDSISPTELLQVANETVLIAGTASEEQQILFAGDKLPKNLDICDVNKLSRNGFNIVRTGDWLFVNGTSPHGPAGVSTSYMEKLMDS
uniref:Uncharacterized protein n=1 Tax=Fibrocapsa japonica TaxID=94617 RepID=A0A7S2UXZ7_9STRA